MRVLQHVKHHDETKEEVSTLTADREEIHEVIAMARHLQEVGQGGETDMAKF